MSKSRELGDAILLKAERQSVEIKEKAKKRISEMKKKDISALKKEVELFEKRESERIEKDLKEEYNKRLYDIKRKINIRKREIFEETCDNIISHIPRLDKKDKRRVYTHIREVIDHLLSKTEKEKKEVKEIVCAYADREIVKNVFKGWKITPSKNILFGVKVEKEDEIIDLTLNSLGSILKEKIKEMLL